MSIPTNKGTIMKQANAVPFNEYPELIQNLTVYNALIGDINALSDWVDTLSHAGRKELREALVACGSQYLIKPLYYDYAKQCWID
jgi:hypothetical protein